MAIAGGILQLRHSIFDVLRFIFPVTSHNYFAAPSNSA